MCGIAGIIGKAPVETSLLQTAAEILAHRGPDQRSIYASGNMGFALSRLSVADLQYDSQPAFNEDKSIVVILDGVIFNAMQLRKSLEHRGHRIIKTSDAAVLAYLYEEYGTGLFERLDGQFSIAIWDNAKKRLVLARDRIGKMPLFYTTKKDSFLFGSEIKAVLVLGDTRPTLSGKVLHEILTYLAPAGEDSIFEEIKMLLPGQWMVYENGMIRSKRFVQLAFRQAVSRNAADATEELEALLIRSVGKRMTGDLTVSAYLSGGLDSSLTTAIAAKHFNKELDTFSISFENPDYDESHFQQLMANELNTRHHSVTFGEDDFMNLLKSCVTHTETPFLRTGPLPMMKLSSWVREHDRHVVLTGEGSDEFFGGYDLFREVKIRNFCRKDPDSKYRSLLFKRINQFVPGLKNMSAKALSLYYNSVRHEGEFGSHLSRWGSARFFRLFLTDEINAFNETGSQDLLWNYLPEGYKDYSAVQKAQQLEIMIFMERYLLSTQGDRVSMANSVECRYPFLDGDVVDYALGLDDKLKIRGLTEKYLVRRVAEKYLPKEILQRRKFPYRAPVAVQKILRDPYFQYVLSSEMLKKFHIFKPETVESFLKKVFEKNILNERELMLFMGVLTTQTLCDCFCTGMYLYEDLPRARLQFPGNSQQNSQEGQVPV
ncbi:MAG: asparagine synthase (glutamine-hydrolyzing) [Ruminiclostridium sp.]|nr:asparagine synthase (glutamine-hydrolyzing) [Ruminiclostridium sp.]